MDAGQSSNVTSPDHCTLYHNILDPLLVADRNQWVYCREYFGGGQG